MDYKEKLKSIINSKKTPYVDINTLLKYFPELELKESEDNRIKNEIIQFLQLPHPQFVGNRNYEKWIAWLEKQGKLVKYYENKLDKCACDNFNKGYKEAIEKKGKQKSAWNKEDKMMLEVAIRDTFGRGHYIESDWLKSLKNRESLKERVQPIQELSDKDKERIDQICDDLKCGMINFYANKVVRSLHYKEIIESNIDWLKSLKYKIQLQSPQWKPSEEHIKALEFYIEKGFIDKEGCFGKDIFELYTQLKELRNE